VRDVEFIRVKISCEDGGFAYGEAPATKAVTGETLQSIEEDIVSVEKLLTGKETRAALDMALFFLLAKQQSKPLQEFFAIKDIRAIKTDITISLGSSEVMLADAQRALREKQNILKVKLGSDIAHAIEITQLLSRELPHARLLIDANQAWNLQESLHYLRETQACELELIEQPVVAVDLESLKKKYVVQNDCADMINIKLMKCGGISKAIEILEYVRKEGVKCMLGSMLEGPYSINAALYLAFAYRDVVKYVDLDSPLLYKELPKELDFIYQDARIFFKNQ